MFLTAWAALSAPGSARAQPAVEEAEDDEAEDEAEETWGGLDPGKGFRVAKTDVGTLHISGYTLWRYLNQLPAEQSFTDHLGREREIDTRNDLQWHRILVHLRGWIYLPRLRYVISIWTVLSTQQVAIPGSLSYEFSKRFILGGGVHGLPGTRTLLGSHPYWLGNDRVMADEFFRPGFTSGAWITGELVSGFNYKVMLGNNLSQLGITAQELTRDLAFATSVWWMPTTCEFGPQGGFGDYEDHDHPATRFGASFTHSREDRFNQIDNAYPDNTQIRLSDSLLLFEGDALAPGVTLQKATYDLLAIDAGIKYRGFHLQAEYYSRWLTDFDANGALPLDSIHDHGFYVQAAWMAWRKRLEPYASASFVFGEFNDAWEVLGGANVFPADTRNFRINAQVIYVDRSPASSVFGYYVGGQKGPTVALASSVMF